MYLNCPDNFETTSLLTIRIKIVDTNLIAFNSKRYLKIIFNHMKTLLLHDFFLSSREEKSEYIT